MNRRELLKRASDLYNEKNRMTVTTPYMTEGIMESVIDSLIEALKRDGKVKIRGLASFELVDYGDKKRGAWDPFHQKRIEYKPKKKIICHFGKTIRDAINEE